MTIDFKNLDLRDSLDLAILIEEEARERYETFAAMIGERYAGDAGDFFESMAVNEETHRKQLSERRRRLFGDAPVRVDPIDIWDVEAPSTGAARSYMSARQAIGLALTAESKAREFFEGALRQTTDPEVKSLFSELRDEEVKHQRLLEKQLAALPPGQGDGPDLSEEDLDEPPALG